MSKFIKEVGKINNITRWISMINALSTIRIAISQISRKEKMQ